VLGATDADGGRWRDWSGFWNRYGSAIETAAKPGTTVLLPEAVLSIDQAEADAAAMRLGALALARDATIIAGIVVDNGKQVTNRALIARPDGIAWYSKQHLVPGMEAGTTPGVAPVTYRDAGALRGVAICKDMHFPTLGRAYAQKGAKLMLVLANDFEVDDKMTANMTAMRGVEGGYAVVRSSRKGLSFVSDPFGRIMAQSRSKQQVQSLVVAVPTTIAGQTIYARIGDVFGWLCVILLAGLVIADRRWRKQPTQ
jgi:apolipoprotein N-acyltransferase